MATSLDFDISIATDKKRRQKTRRKNNGAVETSSRTCDHKGCKRRGTFRAPKSAATENGIKWVCEHHAKVYNSNWDYYQASAKVTREGSATGTCGTAEDQRQARMQKAWERHGIDDPFEVLGDSGTRGRSTKDLQLLKLTAEERRAVQILDVEPSTTKSAAREQYKSLVKSYHPDQNKGTREEEDRLKDVLWAWGRIKNSKHFTD